jgi:NitT/TauT family transport system substrate-binding protein
MRKAWTWTLLLVFTSMLLLGGCGGNTPSAGENAGQSKPVKIGFSALPTWYLWYLVEEKGFFKKHGVDVELVYFPVYGDSVSALSTGEIDGNSQTLLDSIAPLSNNIGLKAVLVTDNSHGGDGLVVKPDITSVKELKGKRVATEIGTIAHFFLLTILNDAGMSEKDVNFTNMSISDAGTSFIAGKLDAAELWEPFLSKAVTEGKGKILVNSAKYPGLIADLLVMREDFVTKRPEDAQKIAAAWFDAVQYYNEHPEESVQIMAKKAGISVEEMKQGLAGFKLFTLEQNLQAYKKGNDYTSLLYTANENAKFLKEHGFISKIPELDSLIDDSILQKVMQQQKQ